MAFVGGAAALISAGVGVHSAVDAKKQGVASRRRTQAAQAEASRIQAIERAREVQTEQAAARPTPGAALSDIDNVLASDLTGGMARDRLRLSRRSTLGGG
jgi:hypothetical protein